MSSASVALVSLNASTPLQTASHVALQPSVEGGDDQAKVILELQQKLFDSESARQLDATEIRSLKDRATLAETALKDKDRQLKSMEASLTVKDQRLEAMTLALADKPPGAITTQFFLKHLELIPYKKMTVFVKNGAVAGWE